MSVILETSLGDITVDLYTKERPLCCKNFLKLCKIKYYNWCLFHNVQRNLVAQSGDPTCTGRGGESVFAKLYGDQAKFFEWEIKPRIKHVKRGAISMVNNGSNMHGSQFFLTLAENIEYLDGVHTVFGEVGEGLEVLDQINEAIVDGDHRPYRDIQIFHTVVLDDPFDDPAGLSTLVPGRSPEPTTAQLEASRIAVDEEIDDFAGKGRDEIEELTEQKEAQANAQMLELIGDLPSADVEAPDNVLFVCKLNPVTTSEDLEIIFSRFGKIISCEVVQDHKTEQSLQYAFIEFEKPEDCENAYFKMDNVLIDDRRIHVDFSQSVAKLRKGKPEIGEQIQSNSKYVIKDKSRRQDGYQLVIDEGRLAHEIKGGKKSHDGKKRERLDNPGTSRKRESENTDHKQREYKHGHYQSDQKKTHRHRETSRSPSHKKHRERSPSERSDRKTHKKHKNYR